MAKEKNSDNASTTRDVEFRISISSEDIDKIETKVKNDDGDAETQNNSLADGVVLTNTCENCSVKFAPKNSITCEVWCESCIGKKQNVIWMGVLPK
ncbi:hypothetical protein [Nitrosopumilus sp.]|uniref:hypothetical protein n=1 Tax=Nitrosopumilus sp. TaxID=2024843 RepID=UPI003B5AFF24